MADTCIRFDLFRANRASLGATFAVNMMYEISLKLTYCKIILLVVEWKQEVYSGSLTQRNATAYQLQQ